MKRVTVYQRRGQFLIHPSSRTTDGVWLLSLPCLAATEDTDDATLGELVDNLLSQSQENVPHPKQWGKVLQPLLKAAGATSWKAFISGTTCIEVELNADEVSVLPTENLGVAEGFQTICEQRLSLASGDKLSLGRAVREALMRSR